MWSMTEYLCGKIIVKPGTPAGAGNGILYINKLGE